MSVSKNFLLNIVSTVSGILFPMITFPYISRVLLPEYIGKINFSQSIIFYFIAFATLGTPIYGLRELSKNKEKEKLEEFKKTYTELLIIGAICSVASFVILNIILNFSNNLKDNKIIINIYSVQILFSFLTLDHVFIVLERHKRRTIRTLFLRTLSLILIFGLVRSQQDYYMYLLILVIPELMLRIFDFYSLKEFICLKSKLEFKTHMKPLMILFITVISANLYANIDLTMLGFMTSNEQVGIYTSATKMTKILIPTITALNTVLSPKLIYNIKNKNNKKIYESIDIFLDFNFFFGIQFIFFLFLISKEIIFLFSGVRFADANIPMKIMLPIIFSIPIGTFMSRILIANDLEKKSLQLNLFAAVFNGILNYIFIPVLGIFGAAIATVITSMISCILKIKFALKLYPSYQIITKERIKYIILGLISMGITILLKFNLRGHTYIIIIFICGTIYSLCYIILLLLLKDKYIFKAMEKLRKKLKIIINGTGGHNENTRNT